MNLSNALAALITLVASFAVGVMYSHNSDTTPTYCEVPPIPVSTAIRESFLLEESIKWQKEYHKMGDQWLQCTRDLVRVSEECNYDIICSEGTCEDK